MRKIAIITNKDVYSNYGDDCSTIVSSITDWSEVDEETFTKLKAASHQFGFSIIERPIDESSFIRNTIAEWTKHIDEIEQKRKKEKEKAVRLAEEKKLRKLAKTRDDKIKLLKQLKEELGE